MLATQSFEYFCISFLGYVFKILLKSKNNNIIKPFIASESFTIFVNDNTKYT